MAGIFFCPISAPVMRPQYILRNLHARAYSSNCDGRRTSYVSQVNSKLFLLSAQAVLQQHGTTRSSAFAQASLRQWFYYTAFLRGPVVFGSRLESSSNTVQFSGGERLQLIDFQACETKRAAFGGRGITACPTEVTTIEQKQRV